MSDTTPTPPESSHTVHIIHLGDGSDLDALLERLHAVENQTAESVREALVALHRWIRDAPSPYFAAGEEITITMGLNQISWQVPADGDDPLPARDEDGRFVWTTLYDADATP